MCIGLEQLVENSKHNPIGAFLEHPFRLGDDYWFEICTFCAWLTLCRDFRLFGGAVIA